MVGIVNLTFQLGWSDTPDQFSNQVWLKFSTFYTGENSIRPWIPTFWTRNSL